jgi:hypothetical protein
MQSVGEFACRRFGLNLTSRATEPGLVAHNGYRPQEMFTFGNLAGLGTEEKVNGHKEA